MSNSQSTITLQNVADDISSIVDIQPILAVGGYSNRTMLRIANDVMNAICGQSFPWKWNAINVPQFYTNSWQQDYALALTNLASLQRGIVININNGSVPKPWGYVEVVREQTEATGSWNGPCPFFNAPVFQVNWIPNNQLYYGIWGDTTTGNNTVGNNPVANSVYTPLLGSGSMPSNPIMQIQDANGNLLVLTGFGTEGTTAPLAPANSNPGTTATPGAGATTSWTVIDPNGQGMRINPVPSQTGVVYQFNLVGQAIPVRFTQLSQTLVPLPDWFEPTFTQGCVAQAYRYSESAKVREKFTMEWPLWLQSLLLSREKSDKERDAARFVPERSVMGCGGTRGGFWGPQWPFNGPPPGRW